MAHPRKQCISVFVTTQCTCECRYCYLQKCSLPVGSIDLDFAKRGIRDFFSASSSRHLRLFAAGEPTCDFGLVRALRDFAYGLAQDHLVLEIQTNGVFGPDVAEWLARNAHIIWISCDGPPDVQDALRPLNNGGKSSPFIERNIPLLRSINPKITVGVRATITPINILRQVEMLEYFKGLGASAVYSDPVFPPVSSDDDLLRTWSLGKHFVMDYAHHYLDAQPRAKELDLFYGSILVVNFDEKTETFCRACMPCPHLTTDGYVTCCDMAFSGSALPELVYGKYNETTKLIDYDEDKKAQIRLRKASNLVECYGCEILHHCAGGCFGEGVNETKRILGVKKDCCDAMRFLSKHMPLDAGLYPYLHP